MKVAEFLVPLKVYADVLANAGSPELAHGMCRLTAAWSGAEAMQMKTLLQRFLPRRSVERSRSSPSVGDVQQALLEFERLVSNISKKDFVDDLRKLIATLESHQKADLASFAAAVQAEISGASPDEETAPSDTGLIAAYVRRLDDSYKDEAAFKAVFQELKKDKRVKQTEMAEIASRFTISTPKSTARSESLNRIQARHQAYNTSKAKSDFFGGRSAA